MSPGQSVIRASHSLARNAGRLSFGDPVRYVYNPLLYARGPWEEYLRRYADSRKRVIFLGMNPGPWGMAQTGVPFGEVSIVRDWLGVSGAVAEPRHVHPRLRVRGFDCPRSEVSGSRLWGLMRERFGNPEAFSREHFVSNYCPLLFLDAAGRNVTPDKLRASDRSRLFSVCDEFLGEAVRALEPEWIVGVGSFAAARARLLAETGTRPGLRAAGVLHPSPASPRANRDWAGQAAAQLMSLGIWQRARKKSP